MKVVLDTNVVVSGAFFGGPPRAVLDARAEGRFQVILSPSILDEYMRVCDRLRAVYPEADYQAVLTEFAAHGELVPDAEEGERVTADQMTTSSCAARTRRAPLSFRAIAICLTPPDGARFEC